MKMKFLYLNFISLLLTNLIDPLLSTNTCPEKCSCREVPQKDKLVWTKLRCGDTEKIKHLDELDLLNIANEIVNLNLSNNQLSNFSPRIQFLALQRLDLSKNKIEILQNNQFEEVPNVKRLDLSNNLIKIIEPLAFNGLKFLERLKLNQNLIATIRKGTFSSLIFLKQIDISNNPLTCDCELLWLLEWTQKQSVKINSNPKCSSPATFKGVPLRKLKIGTDIHCKSPAGDREIPMIELLLENDQIVFEGDSFRVKCISPFIPDTYQPENKKDTNSNLLWFWKNGMKDVIRSFHVNNLFYSEKGLIESEIIIPKVNQNYSGLLNCQRNTEEGNFTKAINLIVISKNNKFCDVTTTWSNKGTYYWPQTILNNTIFLPCEFIQVNLNVSEQKASYHCSSEGVWVNFDATSCTYVSETTRILEQFSRVDLNLSKSNAYESAKHLKNFTNNVKTFEDVMDLVYLVRTLENYASYLDFNQDLGDIVMDIIDILFTLPQSYLRKADQYDSCLEKVVRVIEDVVSHNSSSSLHKNNVAAEEFSIKKEAFGGMTCSWYSGSVNTSDRVFYCVTTTNPTSTTGMLNRKIEASVQIPASLFFQLQNQEEVLETENDVEKLLVVMMSDARLFPLDETVKKSKAITLPVVGVKLANLTTTNLTEPIYVMLHIPQTYYDSTASYPVWWDEEQGNWTSEGCSFSHEIQDNLIFSCKSLGYYAFLEDFTKYNVVKAGAKFKLSHPAIYVGSFVLFVCLFVTVITYAFCYVSIQMPKKAKHSLINLWIVVMLLVYIYVFGIYQTEDTFLCQIIGIILHYLTLSSLLWVVVGASTMYRRLNKSDVIDEDELPPDQPIQKPILGLYLVGWGIALIVCGISSAVNMKEYSAYDFCFLNSPPALSALYIPVVILFALLGILFLLIRCSLYNGDVNGHLSEGTQATENVDLDMLEPSLLNNDRHSILSVKTRSSEMEDQEHSPSAHLKADIIFLFIYTIAWLCCAFATAQPFHIEYEAEIFSILYAIFASILGFFTLFFYCLARSDVRNKWFTCKKKKTAYFRTRNVSDTSQNVHLQSMPSVSHQNPEAQITSRSSSRSSTKTKSNSNNSNHLLKPVMNVKMTKFDEAPSADKINNVNLVLLHTQQYRIGIPVPNIIENPASTVQMFYNPYQSTVARKFFRKQRQHMMKRNNFPVRKCDSDTTSILSVPKSNNDANQNIFGTSSKVNNTNIHVERIRKIKHKNPNIYSDSCEDLSLPIDKMMINSERIKRREHPRLKKKKQNIARSKETLETAGMRTVSQQCSLEYNSDTSALDVAQMPLDMFELQQTVVHENEPNLDVTKSDEVESELLPKNFTRIRSTTSSFSASELDELYQQIRLGPRSTKMKQRGRFRSRSPCLSDSEIRSRAKEMTKKSRTIYSLSQFDGSVETTV